MAKKSKKYNTKRKSSVKRTREDDATSRITFLWAASHLMRSESPQISRFYNKTIKQIGRRINLPLDAVSVKRHICKHCNALLVPGDASYRLAPKRQSHVVVTCRNCGKVRRYVNEDRTRKAKEGKGEGSVSGMITADSSPEQTEANADEDGMPESTNNNCIIS